MNYKTESKEMKMARLLFMKRVDEISRYMVTNAGKTKGINRTDHPDTFPAYTAYEAFLKLMDDNW